ncbi:DsbA family protein [Caulobacter sp. 17J65-9]|uniref:DsbA family protein n=1 Tax=Caulobacter sp. 17J65-9 TaxID=2709382 RepID=UPI0013CC5567|nr:DsbA family protein [Caulobacter sp. 17J65-9]NEX93487.1 DsbA family protein [Caulobacter sp. 17J65-9]
MRAIARRTLILAATAVAALSLAACGDKGGAKGAGAPDDMTLGKADAPVTVMEYASPTCPHCANWNAEVFPAFKAKYVDTGKVHYVFREAPIHGAVDAATFLLARCAGKDKYFEVVDAMMRNLPQLSEGEDPRAVLLRVAQSAGMDEAKFNACVGDEEALKQLNARMEKEMKEFDVDSTPTFIINGKKADFMGPPTMEQLDAAIQPLLKK